MRLSQGLQTWIAVQDLGYFFWFCTFGSGDTSSLRVTMLIDTHFNEPLMGWALLGAADRSRTRIEHVNFTRVAVYGHW
jgi:hypothetical protein